MKDNKNFWFYTIGRFISIIGSGIQIIALPLYILDITGSGTLMGVFSVLTLVPAFISAPFSGILGDRRNRRNIMVLMDFGRGSLICLLALLALKGSMSIYVLFIAQVFISIMDSLFNSSSGALMPELVEEKSLMSAVSIRSSFDGIANIIGPCLGGIIYAFGGIKVVFFINGISFFLCGILSLFIRYRKSTIVKNKISMKVFLSENGEAINFIKDSRGLLQLFSFALITNFLLAPMFDIIFPYAFKKGIGFSSNFYGYIFASFTLGIVLGNVAIGLYFKRWTSKKLMKIGFIIETLILLLLCGLVFPRPVELFGGASIYLFLILSFCTFLIGFANAFVNTPISTNLQKMVPDSMRSRFFSLLGMFSQGAVPIGCLIYGVLLDKIQYYYLLTVVSVIAAFITFYFLAKACEEVYEPKIAA
jgi:MFS transporter, DHA3 family, macrolide efflux protein